MKPTGEPLVSIIIPFFDAERFLEETVQSVLLQSVRDWELLLVDDGSHDRSTGIARGLAEEHPDRIKYLDHSAHRNVGPSASRNLGLREATGRWVAFLDADDIWLPEMIERSVRFLDRQPEAQLGWGATRYWHSWTRRPEDHDRDWVWPVGVPTDRLFRPPDLLARLLRDGRLVPCPCSLIVRRDFALHIGGFEDHFRKLFTDQVFYAKALLHGTAVVSAECLSLYRQHEASMCARANARGLVPLFRLEYLSWLANYVRRQGFAEPSLREALDTALQEARREVPERRRNRKAPRPGRVRFGHLRRVEPMSRIWGLDRGRPVDRYYIENFLSRRAEDIHGRVLEIGDDRYTRRFGGGRVTHGDVLHVTPATPGATIVADLTNADHVASGLFDCIIATQTLQLIFDVAAALATLNRLLRPGGVLLATVPGITPIDHAEWVDSWYWSFTPRSTRHLVEKLPEWDRIEVEGRGNVLSATAFLFGLAAEELRPDELAHDDPDYPMLITLRARRTPGTYDGSPRSSSG